MENYIDDSDSVLYALARLPGENFTISDKKIHTSFYNLQKKYPELFPNLLFDTNGAFPYSEELSRIFFELYRSGILHWTLNLKKYVFSSDMKSKVLKNLSNKLSEDKKKYLSEASKSLQELCC